MDDHFFIYNNTFCLVGEPVIRADNHGFRYGDGIFETMRMYHGGILNVDFHLERLFHGMKMLQFNVPPDFSKSFFTQRVNELLLKNSISQNARIRLMIFRNETNFSGSLSFPNYIIETFSLSDKIELNEKGLSVDIFPDVKKSGDLFSNLKTNNYLPSVMAIRFAKKNKLDEAILQNSSNRISESTIANIFIVKDHNIYTPPLSEGCVAGTMRRWMIEKSDLRNYVISEKEITEDDLLHANELFLTNAIKPIRWVKNFRKKVYKNEKIKEIFTNIMDEFLKN
ncbi:MAG: aminotransferase class IV [Ginsengibacter sp.]